MSADIQAKKSVDDVWRQLNSKASGAAGNKKAFEKLWFGFSNDVPGVSRPKRAAGGVQAKPSGPERAVHSTQQQQQRQDQSQSKLDNNAAECAALATVSSLHGAALERCVQALQSPAAGDRRAALLQIQNALLAEQASSETVAEALQAQLGKGLLRRFDDASGAVRELAVSLFLQLLRKGDGAVLQLLPYVMPVLEERLQTSQGANGNPVESSEEVRLLLAQLHTHLIKAAGQAIAAYAPEAVDMLKWCCEDSYHEVNMEACAGLLELDGILGMRLHNVSKGIVASLLPLTTHKRHKVRIAAIQAITPIMHQGAHEMILEMVAWRDPNSVPVAAFYGGDLKVNFCGKLATDPHAQVRLEFLHMLGNWMTTLRERLDHEPRLLPYVLSALCDESAAVVEAALQLLDTLGAQYEREHEKELKDAVTYLPDGAQALGWAEEAGGSSCVQCIVYAGAAEAAAMPATAAAAAAAAGTATAATGAAPVTCDDRVLSPVANPSSITAASARAASAKCSPPDGPAVFVLPGPFKCRPRLGTRILAQSNFGRLVGALVAEVGSWQAEPRRRAAQLLLLNLVLVEEGVEQHLQTLLPALAKGMGDATVRDVMEQCCAIVGCFASTSDALALLVPRIEDDCAEFSAHADALLALSHIIRGAAAKRSIAAHISTVLSLLELPAVVCSEDKHMRAAVAAVARQLLCACRAGSCMADAEQICLLWVLLRRAACDSSSGGMGRSSSMMGWEASTSEPADIEGLLGMMADTPGCQAGEVDELLSRHREALFLQQDVCNLCCHDAQGIHAVCRALVPSCHAGALAMGSLVAVGPATAAPVTTTISASSTQTGARGMSEGRSGDCTASTSDAVAHSNRAWWQPGQLAPLLCLLERSLAEPSMSGSSSASMAPAQAKSLRLLLACLDICLASWPMEALDRACIQRVVCDTLPMLLHSGRAVGQLAGLTALQTLLARGLVASEVLELGWRAWGMELCALVPVPAGAAEAVRLQAVHALQDVVARLGPAALLMTSTAAADSAAGVASATPSPTPTAPATGSSAPAQMPQPVAALLAAIDDSSNAVRCAALRALTEVLQALVPSSDSSSSSGSSSRSIRYMRLAQQALHKAVLHQDLGTLGFMEGMKVLCAWAQAVELKVPTAA